MRSNQDSISMRAQNIKNELCGTRGFLQTFPVFRLEKLHHDDKLFLKFTMGLSDIQGLMLWLQDRLYFDVDTQKLHRVWQNRSVSAV